MELDLKMPKHNSRIQCKSSIQSCPKRPLEVCKARVCFLAITRSGNTGVPDLAHWIALCPEQRYEEEADDAVAGRAEVQNAFSVSIGPFQLEDELNDCHLSEGNCEDGEGCEDQLVELRLSIRNR